MADVLMRILLSAVGAAGVTSAISSIGQNAGSQFGSMSKGMGLAADAALGVSAAVIGIGVASVSAASQYQQQMNMVQALTGASQVQMAGYDSQLKTLAINAGVAPTELAKGLYNVLSAGFQGANAMQVLTLATQDAKIGLTDAATTSNALTVALKAFSVPASDFNAVNGEMLRTVTAGKMTMQDYSGAISKSSSVAVQYHDTMEDMNSVLATLTANGVKNAAVASTDYNNLLKVLNGSTDAVIKKSEALNPAFNGNAFASMSVADKVNYLNAMIVQHGHNISDVIGKQQNAAAAFTVLSTHSQDYATNLANLSNQQQNASATQSAWAITQTGFAQSMSRLSATTQVLLIDIGQYLLPVLTNLAVYASGVISAFSGWLIQSGALTTAMHGLGVAFSTLGTWLAPVTSFFQHNAAAMDALRVVGIAFAGAVVGLLVAGFIALAVAAWTAAIGVLALTWPFLAVGAVAALVVVGIILLIQRWGAIAHWLQGIWGAVLGWLRGVWQGFTSWLMSALATVGAFFSRIWSGIVSGVRIAWNFIVNAVKVGVMTMVLIIFGPIIAIGALFVWLYNHNVYFKMLIDAIVDCVKLGIDFLVTAWNTTISNVVAAWTLLGTAATTIWNLITSGITDAVNSAKNFLTLAWTSTLSWLSSQWSLLSGLAQTAWQAVSTVFSSIWSTYLQPPLNTLWTNISSWFDMGAKLEQFGVNAIQGFINGILSMVSNVGNAGAQIAQKLAGFLGFHSPAKEGPGADLMEWPKNLIASYSSGLVAAIPQLQSSLNLVMQPVAHTLSGGTPIPRPTTPLQGGAVVHNHYYNIQTMARSPSEIKRFVDMMEQEQARRFRAQTPQYASGGVF